MPMARPQRVEALGLALLFVIFIAAALFYERRTQEILTPSTPSAFNASAQGVKALSLLLEEQGYVVTRLDRPWNALNADYGLLFLIEPFQRPVAKDELDSLKTWTQAGGTVLYLVDVPPRPLDPADTVFGDVEVIAGPKEPVEIAPDYRSPFTRQARTLRFQSAVRLKPRRGAGYQTLFRDESGALMLAKRSGKGQLLIAAGPSLASNAGIREADNALFLVHLAAVAIGDTKRKIAFDEYHHGVGFARAESAGEAGRLQSAPLPLQLLFWHLAALGLLLVYNGNRRFGRPASLPPPARSMPLDYIHAMARFLRRAGAADASIETLYLRFQRDLSRQLHLPTDSPATGLYPKAAELYNIDPDALKRLAARCEQIVAGERIAEAEMLELARQIEQFRRRCGLVG
jgi:hypothetical protein